MTEPTAVYTVPVVKPPEAACDEPRPIQPPAPSDLLTAYFMRRRDVLIAELREIDRLLGRPQTVPVRER